MNERPESVTVVSWILLVFCGFGYLSLLMIWPLREMPSIQAMLSRALVPPAVYFGILLAHIVIDTLCAAAFLLRQGWARYVYLVTGAASVAYAWLISPSPLFVIPSILLIAGVTTVLFLPRSRHWFAGEDSAAAS